MRLAPENFLVTKFLLGIFFFVLSSSLTADAQSQGNTPLTDTVAIVGQQIITVDDFLERFELMPWPNKEIKGMQDQIKLDAFHSLVAEKLLALDARRLNIGQDSASLNEQQMLERLFVRDELYRRDVRLKVAVSDSEIENGLCRYAWALKVVFRHFPLKNEANRFYSLCTSRRGKNKPFDSRYDSSMVLIDTLTINYGGSDIALENAAYAIKGGISHPVQSAMYGWGIMKLITKFSNPKYIGESLPERLEAVTNVLRSRHEESSAATYLSSVVRTQRAEAHRDLFELLADSLFSLFSQKNDRYLVDGTYILDPAGVDHLMERVSSHLNDNFISLESGAMTLRDVLIGLRVTVNEFPTLERESVRRRLHHYVRVAIQDELLAREGFKKKLQSSYNVQHDLSTWMDSRCAYLLEKKIAGGISVTDAEIDDYFNKNSDMYGVETEVNIREILVDSIDWAMTLRQKIEKGEDMALLAKEYTKRDEWRKSEGESGFVNVSTLRDLGFYAVVADSGKLVGPIRIKEGFSIFKVLGKRRNEDMVRQRLPDVRKSIKDHLQEVKVSRAIDERISDLAIKYGVSIRENVLRKVHTTESSMLTFRYIGFGGRINAMPTLIEQTSWADKWKKKITRVTP